MDTTQPTLEDTWKLLHELSLKFAETDRQFKETALQFKETDRKIKEVSASVGRLSSKLGDYVEYSVRPAAVRLFRERGIDVHEVHQQVSAKRDGEELEVDLLVVNNSDVIAIECKSTLSVDDVNEHLERLDKLKRLLPTYANKRVMGAVTGMVMPDNVTRYAARQGLFVIAQTGEHLAVANADNFTAKIW